MPDESDPLGGSFSAKDFKDKSLGTRFQTSDQTEKKLSLSLLTDLLEVEIENEGVVAVEHFGKLDEPTGLANA